MLARRPRFHPTAPAGWLSDPNGPIQWRGRYHVFYQHNPASTRWGLMHWGHLTSPDLVHWEDEGIAMRPDPAGPDADGCWSGCIREIGGEAVAFYTGTTGDGADHAEVVVRAIADDALRGFRREPAEPVVPTASGGTLQHRDPFLLRWENRWIMLQGTGLAGGQPAGAVVAWESTDSIRWTPIGTVFALPQGAIDIDTGPVWECPQLLRVDGRWVLLISIQLPGSPDPVCRGVAWFVGDFDGARFTPAAHGMVDHGDVFYAPAVTEDAHGRPLMWAWLQESPALRNTGTGEWSGAFSLVRELSVLGDRLRSAPVRESSVLLGEVVAAVRELVVPAGAHVVLGELREAAFRMVIETGRDAFDLTLGRAGDGSAAALAWDGHRLQARVGDHLAGALEASGDDGIPLEIWVDESIVEVFGQGEALTFRVDPQLDVTGGVTMTARTTGCRIGPIEIVSLRS